MHLKRQESPKNWPVERKGTTYLVRPRYNINQGVPVLVVMRDMLKFAANRREVKKALNGKQILLNHRNVFDDRDNVLLFDVVTITGASEKNYRLIIGKNKKFALKEIHGSEANQKTSKVVNKTTLKGGKIQINLSDGRNFLSDVKCRTNDSVIVNLKSKKIERSIPLKKDARVIVFAGKHAGEEGVIKEIDEEKNMVKLESDKEMINILIKQIMVLE